jgi:hypothetical protein
MINLAQNKVACPNCGLRLWGTESEREGDWCRVKWFHFYQDYCEDLFEESYYVKNKRNNYFRTLQEVFGISICTQSQSLLP